MEPRRHTNAGERTATRIGLARLFPGEADIEAQRCALSAAGCERIIEERDNTGVGRPPARLEPAATGLRRGDTLVVWRLDRLATDLPQIAAAVAALNAHGVRLVSVCEGLDTAERTGHTVCRVLAALTDHEAG